MIKQYLVYVIAIAAIALFSACGSHSRRAEIDARKAALKNKQDSTLLATQQELARTDSLLEAVKAAYAQKEASVGQHKAQLKATEQELTELTLLRLRRDSLQVQWQTLGAKIRYIRKKQEEASPLLTEP